MKTTLFLFVIAYTPLNFMAQEGQNTMGWEGLYPDTCGMPVTFEGKAYKTVKIGKQCWFQENLNVGIRINSDQNQKNNGIVEKYCYNDDEANCNIYGGLYHFDELVQYEEYEEMVDVKVKGLCPSGWHIPSEEDWKTLIDYLGGKKVAGGKMKESGTTHWASPNTGSTNSSGFTALPGGYADIQVDFYYLSRHAFFWSSTWYFSIGFSPGASYRKLNSRNEKVDRNTYSFGTALSARCLKDTIYPVPLP